MMSGRMAKAGKGERNTSSKMANTLSVASKEGNAYLGFTMMITVIGGRGMETMLAWLLEGCDVYVPSEVPDHPMFATRDSDLVLLPHEGRLRKLQLAWDGDRE